MEIRFWNVYGPFPPCCEVTCKIAFYIMITHMHIMLCHCCSSCKCQHVGLSSSVQCHSFYHSFWSKLNSAFDCGCIPALPFFYYLKNTSRFKATKTRLFYLKASIDWRGVLVWFVGTRQSIDIRSLMQYYLETTSFYWKVDILIFLCISSSWDF